MSSLQRRVRALERPSGESGPMRPEAIFLCALTASNDEPSEAFLAWLCVEGQRDELSRKDDETDAKFRARVDERLAEIKSDDGEAV